MKKKISIFISTKTIRKDLDLTNIEKSNPGMGATQYLFINLAYVLKRNGYLVELYVDTEIKLKNINPIRVDNIFEAIDYHIEKNFDYLIMRATDDKEIDNVIREKNIKVIFWAHNRIYKKLADIIYNNENIIKNVCVSQHQALSLINHKCREKNEVIINPSINKIKLEDFKRENSVVFMGTFDKNRGLHILAKAWPLVIKKIPNAKLYIIGGNLYNNNNNDCDKYINKVKKYIKKVEKNVEFLGVLGSEKEKYFKKSKIAVLNPYGYEAMPVSGIEFMSMGLPIITIKKYGQKEVVINKYNGLFCKGYKDLAKKIVYLMENDDIRMRMSKNALQYLDDKFNYDLYKRKWIDVINDNAQKYNMPSKFNIEYNLSEKYELFIYNIKNKIGIIPSYFEMINLIRDTYIKLKKIKERRKN